MSENTAPAGCTEAEWKAARDAGMLIGTTSEEIALHKLAEAIRAAEPMRKHVEDFATAAGWKREEGEGAFEFVQRTSYHQGWQDGRREGAGDVHRDTPEVAAPSHPPATPAVAEGLSGQLAKAVEASEAGHDPFCMSILRGKECSCGLEPAVAVQAEPVAWQWTYRWYGSQPEKGWTILRGRDKVAYVGGDESLSDAVHAICEAHNWETWHSWAQYAKDGETAQQCIERHRGEQDALLGLLAKERSEPAERFCDKCGYVGPNELHQRPNGTGECGYLSAPSKAEAARPKPAAPATAEDAVSDALRALQIADKFCGSLTSDVCPDEVHIPIREAILALRSGASAQPAGGEHMDDLRRMLAAIAVVGQIDGHDVIRRLSVLDLTDRARGADHG